MYFLKKCYLKKDLKQVLAWNVFNIFYYNITKMDIIMYNYLFNNEIILVILFQNIKVQVLTYYWNVMTLDLLNTLHVLFHVCSQYMFSSGTNIPTTRNNYYREV